MPLRAPRIDEPETALEMAEFIDDIRDTLEIGEEYPLSHQMRVQFKWSEQLETMHRQGFVLYVGQRVGRMEGGYEEPCDWLEAMICIRPLAECLIGDPAEEAQAT